MKWHRLDFKYRCTIIVLIVAYGESTPEEKVKRRGIKEWTEKWEKRQRERERKNNRLSTKSMYCNKVILNADD